MTQAPDDAQKEHEPTPKRLEDARRKGEVPQSTDLTKAATYGGFLLACVISGEAAMLHLGEAGTVLLDQADRLGPLLRDGASAPLAGLLARTGVAVAPFFVLPAAAALLSLVLQGAVTAAPEKLTPRLSRLSPLAGIKRRFGREGLFDFLKSTVKLGIISVVLGLFLMSRMDEILGAANLSPVRGTVLLLQLSVGFLCLVLLEATVIGAGDLLWQRAQFLRRNRMTRQEVMDELRQAEGDPHMKSARRQRGTEIAMNRMLLDVPGADVIIVNPTHYAVALIWNRTALAAPVCVAKGADAVAARIRERARDAGVPILDDAPTARALFATVEIGQQIRPEHYRAVAAAIRFAEAMRSRTARRG